MNNKIYTYHVAKLRNLQCQEYYIHHVVYYYGQESYPRNYSFYLLFLLKMYTLPLMFHLRDGSSVYSTRLARLVTNKESGQTCDSNIFWLDPSLYSTCTIPWWWWVGPAGLVAELKLIFCCSGLTLSRLNWVPPAVPFFFSIDQSKQKGNVSLITSKF